VCKSTRKIPMMHKTNWANDQQTAVFVEFNGGWEAEDFINATNELRDMLNEVGHAVSVVVNIRDPRPISMSVLGEVRNFLDLDHPNRDQVVFVAPDGFLQGIQNVIIRTFGGNAPIYLHFANDLDKADKVLKN